MLDYLALFAGIFALIFNIYWQVVRPARKARHRAELEAAAPAKPVPLPKIPADETRPYLADRSGLEDPEDPRLSTCPICGMSDPGNLDAAFTGWPAHSECKEWLGFWAPRQDTGRIEAKKAPGPYRAKTPAPGTPPRPVKISIGGPFPPSDATGHFTVTRHFPREGAPDLWEVRCGGGAVFAGSADILADEVAVHMRFGCHPERRSLS